MAASEQHAVHHLGEDDPDYSEDEVSETPERISDDDSETDPTFDILEETYSRLSQLSFRKKSKSRLSKENETSRGSDSADQEELISPKFDEEDEDSLEKVLKLIDAGQLDKLKVVQCKLYLRKHCLRLTGNKDTLIRRIKEHIEVVNGGGEAKYPVSSFVLNCKGDACTGDVVLFEQNVYDMFNIASRSATGPPCGTRMIAGRIVKESYGSAKQQHTFTVEVLWSKGEKPLPPLHPLLIKGRNLYRLKTMRQRWDNEAERQKILMEKHSRGSNARANRESRVQEKEARKMHKSNRPTKNIEPDFKRHRPLVPSATHSQPNHSVKPATSIATEKSKVQIQMPQETQKKQNHEIRRGHPFSVAACKENIGFPHAGAGLLPLPNIYKDNNEAPLKPNKKLSNANSHRMSVNVQEVQQILGASNLNLKHHGDGNIMPQPVRNWSHGRPVSPFRGQGCMRQQPSNRHDRPTSPSRGQGYTNSSLNRPMSPSHGHIRQPPTCYDRPMSPIHGQGYTRQQPVTNSSHSHRMNPSCGQSYRMGPHGPTHGHGFRGPELCRDFAKGRCCYGDRCKYLH